jgi:glycosyltransferase involved in cell wall biosynthesis
MMHACDIGVIPSIREGLGLSGVQFLASGVPVVGTDVQGIRDYIVPGETGYLTPPSDILQIAKGIEMLSAPENRALMKEACQAMAMQFDESVSIQQMKTIYDEILG